MVYPKPGWAVITWIAILCHLADSFHFINLKGDPLRSTRSTASPKVSERYKTSHIVLSSTSDIEENAARSHKVDFVSPLLDYGYPPAVRDLKLRQNNQMGENEKPILLYLPGFDGTYICPFIQFPELGTEFEVWCMTIGMEDRSTYNELKNIVLDFVKNELTVKDADKESSFPSSDSTDRKEEKMQKEETPADSGGLFAGLFGGNIKKMIPKKNGRPIYIAGESFGGILASDITFTILTEQIKRNDPDASIVDLQGLVLINPATCYDRSQLATAGPPVAKTPFPFYLLALFSKLVPLFTDEFSVEQLFLILRAKALPSVIDNPLREAYMGRVALSLPTKLEFMPPSTLDWRLNEWLQAGCAALSDLSFAAFPNFRSLIVVGEKDKTLPSIDEAERLANRVTNPTKTKIHVVDGAGHASTCGSRLDLAAVIRNSFPELQTTRGGTRWRKGKRSQSSNTGGDMSAESDLFAYESTHSKRTRMKPEAQVGYGPNFGMEERYDKADIGLNPLLYWSKSNFQFVQGDSQERTIKIPNSPDPVHYKKTIYTAPNLKD